jgi:hypothetical protein
MDLAAYMAMATQDQELSDEMLGHIRFRFLTVKETMDIRDRHKDCPGLRIVHAMLAKADPSLTWEAFLALPDPVCGRVSDLLTAKVLDFQRRPPSS